ncbi:MAG: hypothetical protein AAGA48_40895, partial [Myxococcota bacterium]
LSRVLPLPDKLPPLLATSIRHADLRAVAPSLSAMEIPVSTGSSNAFWAADSAVFASSDWTGTGVQEVPGTGERGAPSDTVFVD